MASSDSSARPLEIFLFIDALGYDIATHYHFMENEFPFRKPARMQFGYSCTALPTILSGIKPEEHGHLSLFYYDPDHSPFKLFRFFPFGKNPKSFFNRGRIRHWISKILKKLYGFTGYFQIYSMPFHRLKEMNYCEPNDIFAPGGLAPCANLADLLRANNIRGHISNWRKSESENFAIAEQLLAEDQTDFYFLYAAELDGLLHDHVGDEEIIADKLNVYATKIRRLLEVIQKTGRPCRFTIFTDHGMTPLRGTVDVKSVIEQTNLVFGKDYALNLDSTMARFYFLSPDAEEILQKAVNDAKFPGRWLGAAEKSRNGIVFPDNRYGNSIFLMDPGYQIVPSDMGQKPLNGMHGFDPEDKDSTAAVLSNRPLPDRPLEVSDYFRLMESAVHELREGAITG